MANQARVGIAGILIASVTMLAAPQATQADVGELLQKLNLTVYPRGTKPPAFNGRTADGETVSLASLRGKVVLINFWAAWCEECRPEMPMFERLHRDFAAKGLSVIGINAREGTAAIRGFAKELGLTFPLILDPKGEINVAYGVIGLPTTFLIGRDGQAVALAVGPREWGSEQSRAVIRALLAESVTVKGTR
jgi:peroxiredoxin